MNATETITKLQAAFRRFDESADRYGLYAIHEFRGHVQPDPENRADWILVLRPALSEMDFASSGADFSSGTFGFKTPETQWLVVRLVRLSKVMVYQHRNTYYRVDPRRKHSTHSAKARVRDQFSTLAHSTRSHDRLLVLLGFAAEAEPFKTELTALQEEFPGTTAPASAAVESWQDPYGRGFQTLCACWYWERQATASHRPFLP